MKLLFTLSLLFVLQAASAEEMDRMPSIYVAMQEADSTVEEGKAVVKINFSRLPDEGYYKVDTDEEWVEIEKVSKEDFVILTLPADNYHFKFLKKGYEDAVGHTNLESQTYYELEANLYKERIYPEYPIKSRKPAVYLYSDSPVDLKLEIEPKGTFDFVYPAYDGVWDVRVDQDGLSVDGKNYGYLFWEGLHNSIDYNKDEGYTVAGANVVEFLEDKLDFMGFNTREKQDFICYWAPILVKNKWNKIHFLTGEAYDTQIATYKSSVEIDSELRVLMLYQAINAPEKLIEQQLPRLERSGLTLLEWGGAELPSDKTQDL